MNPPQDKTRDGMLGHQFVKRLESFAPSFSVSSTGRFYRKPYYTLVLKNKYQKICEQEKSSLFMNSI
jgi:hypothetical protein